MTLPALIDAQTLNRHLEDPGLLVIDLCGSESYAEGHIPGAVHVPPTQLSSGQAPAPGRLPPLETLTHLFESIGLTADQHVVVYDDAGSSWAGRMIWTLDVIGHTKSSLLDGGIEAWQQLGLPLSQTTPSVTPSRLSLQLDKSLIADKQEILDNLDNPNYRIWDARSPEEYRGEKVQAARGGHIPGAVNLEWTDLMDEQKRLLTVQQLQDKLDGPGLDKTKTIITHCQTHRRSGLTYFVARKMLNYPSIKAYPGSWSEWGNSEDVPIETV